MPQDGLGDRTVAGLYKVVRELGSGGGGVVYLARHKRLGKFVAVKADKRTLSTKPEVLRREVDVMKNLSHTYIPQVYDFVAEDNTVYTVMDYVEGESLDKPLKRGERFSQAQIIEWTCQLLEALDYLHSRPPHGILHSDIKPANIMVTPQGDIRLIDFNIALALGEEGAVRVGLSRGYASPEHYGIDYSVAAATQFNGSAETILETDKGKTMLQGSSSSSTSRRTVCLDIRSDIYSLGATVYHLLTGRKPANDAKDVIPISETDISPAVATIIRKAMAPDPDQRYQSAREMLVDLEHLHENDPRNKRHKRRIVTVAAVLVAAFLAGGASALVGLRQMQQAEEAARIEAEIAEEAQRQAKEAEQVEKEALAAVSQSEAAYRAGDIPAAVEQALRAMTLDTPYCAQAQKALTDALGIYDLSAGFKSYLSITLPSAPIKLELSPSGERIAVLTSGVVSVYDTSGGEKLVQLAADPSALSDVRFFSDDVLIYAGEDGLCAYDLANFRELWRGEPATGIASQAGGFAVAAIYKDGGDARIYDTSTGSLLRTVDFEGQHQRITVNDVLTDPEDELFAIDAEGRWLAASFEDGALWIYSLNDGEDLELFDVSDYTHFEGDFWDHYLAFAATGTEESIFVVIDLDKMEQMGGFSSSMPFHVQTDDEGIYVSTEDVLVKIDPETGNQTETAYTSSKDILAFSRGGQYTAVLIEDGSASIFDRTAEQMGEYAGDSRWNMVRLAGEFAVLGSSDTPQLRVLKLEDHSECRLLSYDVNYVHDEARVSSDGTTAMLFRYDGFRIYDMNSALLAETLIPDAEQVYDQQFRRDEEGDYLEVIYNDGLTLRYSALTGKLLSETMGEVPDKTFYEEFVTDRLKIISPLHGTPTACDRETGEFIRDLETDAYLTYVTQIDSYVITEYVEMQGARYGLLLDENCETLAYLPGLCDILPDGTLVFDDMKGNLRTSRVYSVEDLAALGGA